MVRYDQATRVEKLFVGGAEVTETVLAPTSFVRGRWFVVDLGSGPPTGASNLELYIQSTVGNLQGGDGLFYRKMTAMEYSYSAATGFISLAKTADSKLLAWYTDCTAGLVSVNSRSCVHLV